jgi:hypothetical protein
MRSIGLHLIKACLRITRPSNSEVILCYRVAEELPLETDAQSAWLKRRNNEMAAFSRGEGE